MLMYIMVGLVGLALLGWSLVFGDHDHGHDVGHDFGHDGHDGHSGPSLFSPLAIGFFLTGFGGAGTIAKVQDFNGFSSAIAAVVVGLALYGVSFFLLGLVYKQQSDSTVSPQRLVGRSATITLAVTSGGQGKVSCSGVPEELTVRSQNGEGLPEGTPVRIVSGAGGGVYVVQRAN